METIVAVPQRVFIPGVESSNARNGLSKWPILIALGIVVSIIAVLSGWWITTRVRTARVKAQADQDLSEVKAAIARITGKGFTNKLGMKFALIPHGSFLMGSDTGGEEEQPVHRVTISQDFYLQTTEVTQAQWSLLMKFNPSYYLWPTHPVDRVDWSSAQDFVKQLNELNDGYSYRLPTEAEWEYACRAGTTSDYYGELDSVCWYDGNSQSQMQEVGKKQPNAFGLYDMLGNAEEWCQDSYDWKYYQVSPELDPTGPAEATDAHVVRGGAFSYGATKVRSASREGSVNPFVIQGFRVAATHR
jgi:formylglycine-generating enzyme required for sulfatase activity